MVTPLEGCLIETRLYILAVFSIIFYTHVCCMVSSCLYMYALQNHYFPTRAAAKSRHGQTGVQIALSHISYPCQHGSLSFWFGSQNMRRQRIRHREHRHRKIFGHFPGPAQAQLYFTPAPTKISTSTKTFQGATFWNPYRVFFQGLRFDTP